MAFLQDLTVIPTFRQRDGRTPLNPLQGIPGLNSAAPILRQAAPDSSSSPAGASRTSTNS